MGNQQPSHMVYVSDDCKGRLYVGYHYGTEDDKYLGSCRDKTFKPVKKYLIHKSEVKIISQFMERQYQKLWKVGYGNDRFANGNYSGGANNLFDGCSEAGIKALKAYTKSPQHSKNVREYNLNKKDYSDLSYLRTPEAISKSSQSRKNNPQYAESKRGENNGMFGKTHNDSAKLKQRIARYKQFLRTGKSGGHQLSESKLAEIREKLNHLEGSETRS